MRLLISISFLFITSFAFSQTEEEQDTSLYAHKVLREVIVFDDRKEYRLMYALAKYYVPKVYPYALLIKDLNAKFNRDLAQIESKREQKKYIKLAKKSLKLEFDHIVRNMSENEGKYLCKLVHRETGLTVYDIIQKYNGDFSAFTWQALSKIGGADLKYDYDLSTKEDYVTEIIVGKVRTGEIALKPIEATSDLGELLLTKRELRKKKREMKN